MTTAYQVKAKTKLTGCQARSIKKMIGNARWVNTDYIQLNEKGKLQYLKKDTEYNFEVCIYHPEILEKVRARFPDIQWKP